MTGRPEPERKRWWKRGGLRWGWLVLLVLTGCLQPRPPQPVTRTPDATAPPVVSPPTSTPLPTQAVTPAAAETSTPTPVSPAPPTPVSPAAPTPTSPAAPTGTAPPPPTRAASPIPPAAATPVIDYFRSNIDPADPGDTITLSWATRHGSQTILYTLMATGQLGSFWEVPPVGTMTFAIPETSRNGVSFLLVSAAGDAVNSVSLTVVLTCPDVWFFTPAPDGCPGTPPLASAGAYQPFERGQMVWVEATGQIVVLFNGPPTRWRAFQDSWREGDPVDDPSLTPPAGLFQPRRGFGLVWRRETGLRDDIGWATVPESGFQTVWQRDSRPKYNEFYLRAPDGRVWHLLAEGSGWRVK